MAFLRGLFRHKRLPPQERAAVEQYIITTDPLLRQLESEYQQWLERVSVTRGTDVSGISDTNGEHSGVFVWRTIETERTFTQTEPPARARAMHNAYVDCVEARHQAATTIYNALQVAEVHSPQAHLQEAGRILREAEGLRKKGDKLRQDLERALG